MTFGGVEGVAAPAGVTPELENWFAQVISELRKLYVALAVTEAELALIDSGVYTPTLTHVVNVAASTARQCQWLRVGSTVTVSGIVDVDPTAAGGTELGISLPVASNFGATEDCAGVAHAPTNPADPGAALDSGAVLRDVANNRAGMQWTAVDTANRPKCFTFTYRVI